MEIHFRRVDNFLLPPPLPLRWLRTWWGEGGGRCQICSLQPFHRNLLAPLLLPRNFCILRSPLAPPPARGPPKSRANLPTFPPPPPALRVPMANLGKFLWGDALSQIFHDYFPLSILYCAESVEYICGIMRLYMRGRINLGTKGEASPQWVPISESQRPVKGGRGKQHPQSQKLPAQRLKETPWRNGHVSFCAKKHEP